MTNEIPNSEPTEPSALSKLKGREVVLDLQSTYVVLGTLAGEDHRYVILKDADVHDLRDTTTTRDAYILEARRHGIQPNRKRVLIRHSEIVSLSALDDVLV
jgi:hypothetical protein